MSLTGREARHLASQMAQDIALPLPYHVLFLSICHLVSLIYSSTLQITTKEWRMCYLVFGVATGGSPTRVRGVVRLGGLHGLAPWGPADGD